MVSSENESLEAVWMGRRAEVMAAMAASVGESSDAVMVLPAAAVFIRNQDVEHEYRQHSDFAYLSGFEEQESVLVLDAKTRKTTIFVRERDPARELWDGPRAGLDGAKATLGVDEVLPIKDFIPKLPDLLSKRRRLYYRLNVQKGMDESVLSAIDALSRKARTGVYPPSEIVDPGQVVHELRLRKDPSELATMRRAATISCVAHARVMAEARPGMAEYELEASLLDSFRRAGSDRVAYGSIVASGPNACILHYRAGKRRLGAGELVLVDAGCEYGMYASDITRTFPVDAAFSRPQQAIYELVLEAQLEAIADARPGRTVDDIHRGVVRTLTKGLVRLGLLSGEVDELIEKEAFKAFYPHRTSHWLGLDVHDVGSYFVAGESRPLEVGMVLTIEPGLYIREDDASVGEEWRGIGVRIEDDILVTQGEPENLTRAAPKSVAEVFEACRR